MTKSTMTFKEFVMSQPADRKIDHDSWSTCAVGDYYREGLKEELCSYEYSPSTVNKAVNDNIIEASLNYSGSRLIKSGPDLYISGLSRVIHTYGDLQDYYTGKLELVIGDNS